MIDMIPTGSTIVMTELTAGPVLISGVIAIALAVALVVYLIVSPSPVRLPLHRRRPGYVPAPSALQRAATVATSFVEKLIRRRGTPAGASTLELAAVRMKPQDFFFLVLVACLVAAAAGLLIGGLLLALLLVAVIPLLVRIALGRRVTKRQRLFAEQLDDSLQLMASNLRAGHSLPQSLNSVAQEADSPTAEEFARIVNETRVGRDLSDALEVTAQRMDSEDFFWVTQAIDINREIGGNLAEVLDGVADTIRQRGEVRRQVATLSAEGRLSALVLMVLPFGIGGFLLLTNPSYLAPFTESLVGYGLLGLAVVMLLVGGFWLKKTVEIKF